MKTNKPKHIMTVEEAIAMTTKLFQSGAAPIIIASALRSDNFSIRQTETIMRWAFIAVFGQQDISTQEPH